MPQGNFKNYIPYNQTPPIKFSEENQELFERVINMGIGVELKEQADRFNDGKPEVSMVFEARRAILGCAEVLTFGAKKYERGNWRKGLPCDQIVDSLGRHLLAMQSGEENDPETGLPHANHILCNALFLAEMKAIEKEEDA